MPTSRAPFWKLIFMLGSILLVASSALAQNTYVPAQPDNTLTPADPIGVPPYVSSTGTNESINLSNGGLTVFLKALSLPQRGGWNLTLGYFHNSMTYSLQQQVSVSPASFNESGKVFWGDEYTYNDFMYASSPALQTNLPTLEASIEYLGDQQLFNPSGGGDVQTQFPVACVTNWTFTDWSGNKHPSPIRAECTDEFCPQTWFCHTVIGIPSNNGTSTDSSFLSIDSTNKADIRITTKDGTIYHFTDFHNPYPNASSGQLYDGSRNQVNYYRGMFSSMADTNGNAVSLQTTQSGYTLTDTIGRQINIASTGITYKDSNGKPQTINLVESAVTSVQYSFPGFSCSFLGQPVYQLPFTPPVITTSASNAMSAPYSIDLSFPASDSTGTRRNFHMQFDVLNHLTQINYPSGGYTKYDYAGGSGSVVVGQVRCQRPGFEIAHKRECPLPSGNCSSSQELVTTYSAVGNALGNVSMDETDPLGALTHHDFSQWTPTTGQMAPRETDTHVYSSSGVLLRTVHTDYTGMVANQDLQLPAAITTTLNDVSPSISSVEKRQYQVLSSCQTCYTLYIDNPIEIDEYDYDGTLKKQTAQTWEPSSNFTVPNISDRLASRTVTDTATGIQSTLSLGYDSAGNVTSKSAGGTGLTSLTTSYLRNGYGQITQVTDPKKNITKFGYQDTWAETTCAPTSNSSAYLTSVTDALNHTANFSYDSCTGAKASATDPNGAKTSFTYDALGRTVSTTLPDGGQTSSSYVDATPNSATQTTLITSGLSHISKTTLDGFARAIQSQLTSDPGGITFVDTAYDSLGRKAAVSNPHRAASAPTDGVTTNFYDALGRICLVVPPDGTLPTGSACPATQPSNTIFTTYSGNTTTVTDQAGKSRKSVTDALGRLTQVLEDPSGLKYETDYAYDAFGNLTCAEQHGSASGTGCSSSPSNDAASPWRIRRFTYDPLSRLLTAKNPESGTISYTYDADSNLLTKKSPAPNQTASLPTPGRGSVSISGAEKCASGTCDQGTVQITVNGYVASYSYGSSDSSSSIASALASALNNSSSPVTAQSSGSIVNLTSSAVGASTNYSLSASSSSGAPLHLANPSFHASPSGSALTGGTDPPTVTLSYCYDALNRLTSKAYATSTACPQTSPVATYLYDQSSYNGLTIANGIGRRTGMTDTVGSEAWSFDSMGRPLTDKRITNAITKTASYTYNFDGSLATLTNPSGRIITYAYNAAARQVSAVDTANSINYATAATYAPTGALSSLTNGPSLVQTFYYNSRLQPCRISVKSTGTVPSSCTDATAGNVLDFTYNFSLGSGDNGNVIGITNNRDTTRSQSFTYDALNRLFTAKTSSTSGTKCWDEQFGYDPWANLLTIGRISGYTCSNEELLTVAATAKNQISGYIYDAAGNLINDNLGHVYTFNAENQLLTAGGVTYTYDGDGKRAQKSSGKLYWYGMGSDPLTESDASGNPSAEYIFFNGKRTARLDLPSAVVHYYFSDHLGSASVVTSNTGTIQDESDYYPFGGERTITNSAPNNYKFTGKERDSESGLDEFGARYYYSAIGRFTIPDWAADPEPIPYANLLKPQSLNLYGYVDNNPTNNVDPDGHAEDEVTRRMNKAVANLKIAGSTIGGALGKAGNALYGVAKDTLNSVGSGIGQFVAGVESGNNGEARAGADKIATTVLPLVFTDGESAAGTAVEDAAASGAARSAESVGSAAEGAAGRAASDVPESIPAGPSTRPTAAQQRAINEMGEAHGCSTCGTRNPGTKSGNFVGDHQPPTAQNPPGGTQVYKPQCLQCSRQQGGQVAAAVKKAKKQVQPQ